MQGNGGAYFCSDGDYRYFLQTPTGFSQGPEDKGVCLFLMLNPGTESGYEEKTHRTRNKCKGFAARWGYATLWTCNLFAIGGAKPEEALARPQPIGPANDPHIRDVAKDADRIVLAWGSARRNRDMRRARACNVVKMLDQEGLSGKLHQLNGLTQGGQPRHPGRLGYKATCTPLDTAAYLSRCKRWF